MRVDPLPEPSWDYLLGSSFLPTVWAGGFMPDHAFDYLIENIEPGEFQAWPMKIGEILRAFAAEELLRQSNSYIAFLEGQVRSK